MIVNNTDILGTMICRTSDDPWTIAESDLTFSPDEV